MVRVPTSVQNDRPSGFATVIAQRTRSVIEDEIKRSSDFSPVRSLWRMQSRVTHEYEGRFLIELIQNAHDAHPPRPHDGAVYVKVDLTEGEYGCVYVANGGRPFNASNFKAICDMGISDKIVGQDIGNKGVGFRSVLQVSDWPEIYSADPDAMGSEVFRGFCFGFAKPDDVRRLTGSDTEAFARISENVPPYFLPVSLTEQNATIREFATQGFVSVIRLPLKSAIAREEAQNRFIELEQADAPVLLFLDRMSSLTLELVVSQDVCRVHRLQRRADAVKALPNIPSICYQHVDLADQGTYFLARLRLAANDLLPAVRQTVEAGLLDTAWTNWRDDAWVSVATRLDGPIAARMYTYLPTHVPAPFSGHVSAPFYTKLARTHVSEEIPLNTYLMDRVADLCVEAVCALARSGQQYAREAAVDLLYWNDAHGSRIEDAFARSGRPLINAPILPIVSRQDGRRWGTLCETFAWDGSQMRCLTISHLATVIDGALLDPDLGNDRVHSVRRFHLQRMGREMTPHLEELAAWMESIAAAMPKSGDLDAWDGLYDDVAVCFNDRPDALRGRRILLDEEGKLRTCGQSEEGAVSAGRRVAQPTVFFPPARERGESLSVEMEEADPGMRIPRGLRSRVTYMHPGLTWSVRDGRTRRKPSQDFFERHGLIQPYRAGALLQVVRDVLAHSTSKRIYEDTLRFVYRLYTAAGAPHDFGITDIHLRVPTRGGWLRAGAAHFSKGWPGSDGELLERLITQARDASAEIANIMPSLLLTPEQWPWRISDRDACVEFLRRAGVRDGLWPLPIRSTQPQLTGGSVYPSTVATTLRLGTADASLWVPTVEKYGGRPYYVTTPYVVPVFWRLPGQSQHAALSESAKGTYARLVMRGLDRWSNGHLFVTFHRPPSASNKDAFQWPTPLDAFLRMAPWVPLTRPGEREREDFVRIDRAWHLPDESDDSYPKYAPLLPVEFRRQIEQRQTLSDRLRQRGLHFWSRPEDAGAQLAVLAEIFLAGGVDEGQLSSFRKAYERVLADSALGRSELVVSFDGTMPLLVSRGGRVAALWSQERVEEAETIYVRDGQMGLAGYLLDTLGAPVVSASDGMGAVVVNLLRGGFPHHDVKRVSDVKIEVLADGGPVTPTDDARLLVEDLPWLDAAVALTMEYRGSRFDHSTERIQRRALDRLRRVRLRRTAKVDVAVDGQPVALPPSFKHALPVRDDAYPTLVLVGDASSRLTCMDLAELAPALADLLQQPSLENGLGRTFLELQHRIGAGSRQPSDDELAEIFHIRPEQVRELLSMVRGAARIVMERLYPVVAHVVGADEAEVINPRGRGDALDNSEAIETALAPLAVALPRSPQSLVELCARAESLPQVRDWLGLDYGAFNRTLRSLGAPYHPIRDVDAHEEAFQAFVHERRGTVLASLRARFLPLYERAEPLDEYVRLRALPGLARDPAWLDECAVPNEALMASRVNDWLVRVGAAPMGKLACELPPLHQAREQNARTLHQFGEQAGRVVRAWCRQQRVPSPLIWGPGSTSSTQLGELAGDEGLTDFGLLSGDRIITWLAQTGRWPDGMPWSLDLSILGLGENDLRAEESAVEEERRRREQARRTIEIDGQPVLADPSDFRGLIDYVNESISPALLATPLRFARMEPVRASSRSRDGVVGSTATGSNVVERLSEVQKTAIGLVGELVAYRWLLAKYPAITDDCWRSTYRNYVLGGSAGDDGLGYDFEVRGSGRRLYFEVKASTGDAVEIELGASEVAMAQRVASHDQYRILLVRNALDSTRRRIHILPNPHSERGVRFYRQVGSALRYRFQLA
jgi:hypothetical protein